MAARSTIRRRCRRRDRENPLASPRLRAHRRGAAGPRPRRVTARPGGDPRRAARDHRDRRGMPLGAAPGHAAGAGHAGADRHLLRYGKGADRLSVDRRPRCGRSGPGRRAQGRAGGNRQAHARGRGDRPAHALRCRPGRGRRSKRAALFLHAQGRRLAAGGADGRRRQSALSGRGPAEHGPGAGEGDRAGGGAAGDLGPSRERARRHGRRRQGRQRRQRRFREIQRAHAARRLYNSTRNYPASEDSFRKALEIQTRVFGGDGPGSGEVLLEVALAVSHQGRYAEAGALFRRAEPIVQKLDPIVRGRLFAYLAIDASLQGRYQDALGYARESMALRRREVDPNTDTLADLAGADPKIGARGELVHALLIEGDVLLKTGDIAGAEVDVNEALQYLVQVRGLPQWWKAQALALLAELEAAQGRYSFAERNMA